MRKFTNYRANQVQHLFLNVQMKIEKRMEVFTEPKKRNTSSK